MKLTKKLEAEIKALMDDYWNSYMKGNLKHWGKYLPDDYRNIGGTKEEIWNTKKEILDYTKAIADQIVGMADIRNKTIQIIPYDPYFMVHEFMDMFIKVEGKFTFYGKFRLSSLIEKTAKGWKVLHQHGSYPDSKTEEGEAFAFDKIKAENIKLKDAVQRRTIELEEKNRELEIETALEKIRAIAMSMKEPKDMLEVCKTIAQQLQSLGVKEIRNVQTAIFYESRGTYMNYEYYARHRKKIITDTSYTNHKIHKAFANQMLKGKDEFFTSHIKGKKVKEWLAYQKTTNVFIDKYLSTAYSLNYYWDSLGPVALGISTYVPLNEEGLNLFKKFRNVFELAYTRYLDIEQALVQAREAQIETALERVRSRSLAMHNTSELQDIINTVHKELLHLNIAIDGGSFIAINSDIETELRCWGSGGTADTTEEIHIPLYKKPFCINIINRIKNSPGFFTEEYTQKEKKDFFTFLFKHDPWKKLYAKQKKETLSSPGGYTRSCLVSKHTSIFIINHLGEIFSAADNDILQRFGKVFEQAYTRFLDLQKAETQAKEARIETALERVRAVAMAMKKSDEVINVCEVMYKELQSLGFTNIRNAQIALKNDSRQSYSISVYSDNESVIFGEAHYHSSPIVKDLYRELEQSKDAFYQREFSGKKFNDWRKWREGLSPFADSREASATSMCFYLYSIGIGHIGISTFNAITEIQIEMLKRFKNVFELCYTRYIDVAKAEVQAREAQIELGLERVRARAMAMQHSDELSQLVDTVFKELANLDFALNWCIINIIDEPSLTNMVWAANPETNKPPESYLMKFEDYPFHHSMMKGYRERKAKHVYVLEGKEKKDYDEYLFNKTEWRRVPKKAQAASRAMKRYVASFTFSNFGGLQTVGEEPLSDENLDILSRFGKVFDLTYTRFNDLQKAEAQSREAQIELGLERVRARAMAMQKSDELKELIGTVFIELTKLDLVLTRCLIMIYHPKSNDSTWWMANSEAPTEPIGLNVQYHEQAPYLAYIKAWNEKKLKWTYSLEGKIKKQWDDFLFTETGLSHLPDFVIAGMKAPDKVYLNASFNSFGNLTLATLDQLSDEHFDIMLRFAKVFDLTYTRFNDLKQAEAQAREAKIETALEKVRSRSMGMQKSEELKEVIQVVYDQFVHLNINTEHAGFVMDYKLRDDRLIWVASKYGLPSQLTIPYFDSVYYNSFNEAKEKGWDFFATNLNFEEKNNFYRQLFAHIPGLPEADREFYFNCPGLAISTVLLENIGLYIENFEGTPYSGEDNAILMRFGKVFQQTYTRFLDLQKAEAQAREAQIEAALEKVRSRSLAMHKSDEIGEIVWTVVEKMKELKVELNGISLVTYIPDSKDTLHWHVNPDLPGNSSTMLLPYFDDLILKDCNDAKEKGIELLAKVYTKEQKDSYFNKAIEVSDFKYFPEELKKWALDQPCLSFSFAIQKHSGIFLEDYNGKIFSEKENDILIRFSRVFEQSYTRFLDLQKAETQSRENQIQLALERARTQSMVMQHSNELDNTLLVFHEQILLLGIPSAFSFLWLPDEEKSNHIFWAAWEEGKNDSAFFKSKAITYPLDRNEPATAQCLVDWRSDEPVHSYAVKPAEVDNYFAAWAELLDGVEKLKPEFFRDGLYYVEAFMKYGCFGVMLEDDLSDEGKNILYRFSVEFERTYTRFLDLQKAEAQAREAKIEMALEKIRSRTMAMQRSDELPEAANLLFLEVQALGIPAWSCGYNILSEDKKSSTCIMSSEGLIQSAFHLPFNNSGEPSFAEWLEAIEKKEPFFIQELSGKKIEDHYNYMKTLPQVGQAIRELEDAGLSLPTYQINHLCRFTNGFLLFITYEPVPHAHDIFQRFTKVFEQTYTRFLDLQKAEAQAREAQIEMALEKVRSRTMAMQRSDELSGTAAMLFQEFKKLEQQELIQTTIGIYNEEKNEIEFRATDWTGSGEQVNKPSYGSMDEPTLLKPAVTAWRAHARSVVIELTGEALEKWTNYRNKMTGTAIATKFDAGRRIVSIAFFSKGHLSMSSPLPIPPEAVKTLERFAAVFDGTYTRFLDLQKAEAQAREAQIEAGLERVRSRTLAMQKSDELADTSIVIFEQLINLGIEPNRLFIGIINKETAAIEAWATNEDGTKIGNHFTLNTNRNESVKKMYEGWKKKKKSITIDMTGTELQNYFHYLADEMKIPFKGGLSQKRRVQTIAYFGQGLIGMASPDEQPESTTQLLERFAAVFNLTYTRFNDLKIAEAHALQAEKDLIAIKEAKQNAEGALAVLQSTQKQLIQSEKMASLGELTAGIAHEIQNPLNFVNNFSEVSKELLDEMKEEMDKGNLEDAKEIMNDIIQNLEKINHHGKRADGIVKGMLQHSRSSSGAKEPTDINALCDEYLRLSYHGLRAKDKSFNATMKTDFDNSIGNINILPQDIGRVILNLLTNAFYVVNEKKKNGIEGYEPTVTIATRYIQPPLGGRAVEIKVSDNGAGIPQKVLDKIFQPFFTTKPTGQGTGLGLSLAFDIVTKGHSGELKVETKEGEGSTFIIQIPIN